MKTISFSGSSRNKTIIIVGLLAFGAKTGYEYFDAQRNLTSGNSNIIKANSQKDDSSNTTNQSNYFQSYQMPTDRRKVKCGTLKIPGVAYEWRTDETDHCFPEDATHHNVCCVDIKNIDNSMNTSDKTVSTFNPLSGPIKRNSDPSSYSWCTNTTKICLDQLQGRVEWVAKPSVRFNQTFTFDD